MFTRLQGANNISPGSHHQRRFLVCLGLTFVLAFWKFEPYWLVATQPYRPRTVLEKGVATFCQNNNALSPLPSGVIQRLYNDPDRIALKPIYYEALLDDSKTVEMVHVPGLHPWVIDSVVRNKRIAVLGDSTLREWSRTMISLVAATLPATSQSRGFDLSTSISLSQAHNRLRYTPMLQKYPGGTGFRYKSSDPAMSNNNNNAMMVADDTWIEYPQTTPRGSDCQLWLALAPFYWKGSRPRRRGRHCVALAALRRLVRTTNPAVHGAQPTTPQHHSHHCFQDDQPRVRRPIYKRMERRGSVL